LVSQHVVPFLLEFLPERRCSYRVGVWNCDARMCALLIEYGENGCGPADEVGMSVDVDDVVEVARPTPLGECAKLLGEQLCDRVREHPFGREGAVAVRMENRPENGSLDKHFVTGEIQPHLRELRPAARSSEGDPGLCRWIASPVHASDKGTVVEHELDASLVGKPLTHPFEDRNQGLGLFMTAFNDCEVEIFRETVGLVVALAERRPSLEHPRGRQILIGGDCCE